MPASQPAGKPAAEPAADPSGRAAELEAELAAIRQAAVADDTTFLHIAEDDVHSAFIRGGVTVGRDPSPVPSGLVDQILTAAAEAGVKLLISEV